MEKCKKIRKKVLTIEKWFGIITKLSRETTAKDLEK